MLRRNDVDGHFNMPMADLQNVFDSLDLTNLRTYPESGSVVFDVVNKSESRVRPRIENHLTKKIGFPISVVVRPITDFERIVKSNPFLARQEHLYVTFFSRKPTKASLANLALPTGIFDQFIVGKSELFVLCPEGYDRAKINNQYFETKLGVNCVTRNWKTVCELEQLAAIT